MTNLPLGKRPETFWCVRSSSACNGDPQAIEAPTCCVVKLLKRARGDSRIYLWTEAAYPIRMHPAKSEAANTRLRRPLSSRESGRKQGPPTSRRWRFSRDRDDQGFGHLQFCGEIVQNLE